jgi:hypothetical protein
MSSTTNSEVNGLPPPGTTMEFEQLLAAVRGCSRDQKRVLLDRVLRDLIGDHPDREYTLYNPDDSSYLFLLPPSIHVKHSLTPDRTAELERRSKDPGKLIPFSEVIARLEVMGQSTQEG